MKLPNAVNAYIQREKLTDYLLSVTHPVGRAKAAVMFRYGFHSGTVDALEAGLLDIARTQEVIDITHSSFGVKYVIYGALLAPDGRSLMVRTVWMVDSGRQIPRFVTAYPQ